MLVIRDPQQQNTIKALLGIRTDGKKQDMRMRPYPPNLSRMAARIIEPATGASTWAFGSHR